MDPLSLTKGARETRASLITDHEPVLSPAEQEQVERRIAAMQKLLKHNKLGRYKLELLFLDRLSVQGVVLGGLQIHESGKRLHGGGDVKVYICPGSRLRPGVSTCHSVIPSANHENRMGFCKNCKVAWNEADLVGEIPGRHSYQNWARLVMKYLIATGGDADIMATYSEKILHVATEQELKKQKGKSFIGFGGAKLDEARNHRVKGLRVYTLPNMLKDTAAGADLYNRIYRFLLA